MNDIAGPETVAAPTARSQPRWIAIAAVDRSAARLLGLAAGGWSSADPLRAFNNGAPPVENLTFERTILDTTASTSLSAPAARSR